MTLEYCDISFPPPPLLSFFWLDKWVSQRAGELEDSTNEGREEWENGTAAFDPETEGTLMATCQFGLMSRD